MNEFELEIRTTGKEDTETPWKVAVGGFPGAGKTLFASTAPKPLFLFFNENPRMKSVVDRYIPHAKIVNRFSPDGILTASIQDQLAVLSTRLLLGQVEDIETIVIDTGDELFQGLKVARKAKTGGEWGPGDWSWLGDTYREIINSFIDLPYRLIVLFHLKSVLEDDMSSRVLALQGAPQDEAAGWFDVVGVLDNYEVISDTGDSVTKRVILTSGSRMYPWLKDHSGNLPKRFEISDRFIGDYGRFEGHLVSRLASGEALAVTAITMGDEPEVGASGMAVPTPGEVQEKKKGPAVDTEPVEFAEPVDQSPEPVEELGARVEETEAGEAETDEVEEEVAESGRPVGPTGDDGDPELNDDEVMEVMKIVEDTFGPVKTLPDDGIEVDTTKRCDTCQAAVEDINLLEISEQRFKVAYCRVHFKEEIQKARNS